MTDTTIHSNEFGKLFASNELMGAILTKDMSIFDIDIFQRDPRSFLSSVSNTDIGDIGLSVIENDFGTVNLVLPYYSELDKVTAQYVNELSLGAVSGGEIIISILAVVGAIGGSIAAASITGATLAAGTAAITAGALVGAGIGIGVGVGATAAIGVGAAAGAAAANDKNLDGSSK